MDTFIKEFDNDQKLEEFAKSRFKYILDSFEDCLKQATKEGFEEGGYFYNQEGKLKFSNAAIKLFEKNETKRQKIMSGKDSVNIKQFISLLKIDRPECNFLINLFEIITKKMISGEEYEHLTSLTPEQPGEFINIVLGSDNSLDDMVNFLGIFSYSIPAIKKKFEADFATKKEELDTKYNKLDEEFKSFKEKSKNKKVEKVVQKIEVPVEVPDQKTIDELNKANEALKEKDKLIEELTKQNEELSSQREKDKELTSINNAEVINKAEETKVNETDTKKILISCSTVIDDINKGRYYIGTANLKLLQKNENNNWVLRIVPNREVIPTVSYIDKQSLEYCYYHFGASAQSYSVVLYGRTLAELTGDVVFGDFEYWSDADQKDAIIQVFKNKTLIFEPQVIFNVERDAVYYNAENIKLISGPLFGDYQIVPILDMSENNFHNDLKNKKPIFIKDYPYTLANSIRYVIIKNNLRRVNLVPDLRENADDNYESRCYWKCSVDENIKLGGQPLQDDVNYIYLDDKKIFLIKKSYIQEKEADIPTTSKIAENDESKFVDKLCAMASSRHLCYKEEDLKNFHVCCKASNLVILAGPSGLGKTRLPEIYADALDLNEDNDTLLFVPVNPSFTEPNDLLGYVKPYIYKEDNNASECNNDVVNADIVKDAAKVDKKDKKAEEKNDDKSKKPAKVQYNGVYEESSSQIVSFLKKAHERQDRLHIVIFDEMNLAQIEYWFAPFMSILERDKQDRNLQLYSSNLLIENADKYPASINIGENVLFIGTINLDETTKDISDRLLDRSLVVNLHKKSFAEYQNEPVNEMSAELANYKVNYETYSSFRKNNENYIATLTKDEISFLDDLHNMISSVLPEKGVSFRNIKMISHYVSNAETISMKRGDAFDLALKQSVIRKINGNEQELKEFLQKDGEYSLFKLLKDSSKVSEFKESLEALQHKLKEIEMYGFAR